MMNSFVHGCGPLAMVACTLVAITTAAPVLQGNQSQQLYSWQIPCESDYDCPGSYCMNDPTKHRINGTFSCHVYPFNEADDPPLFPSLLQQYTTSILWSQPKWDNQTKSHRQEYEFEFLYTEYYDSGPLHWPQPWRLRVPANTTRDTLGEGWELIRDGWVYRVQDGRCHKTEATGPLFTLSGFTTGFAGADPMGWLLIPGCRTGPRSWFGDSKGEPAPGWGPHRPVGYPTYNVWFKNAESGCVDRQCLQLEAMVSYKSPHDKFLYQYVNTTSQLDGSVFETPELCRNATVEGLGNDRGAKQ